MTKLFKNNLNFRKSISMKKAYLFLVLISGSILAQEYRYDYRFFTNSLMKDSFYYSKVNFSGNAFVKNEKSKLLVDQYQFNSPGNSLLLDYKNATDGKWEASIEYEEIRGKDFFNRVNFLSFWIKSEKSDSNVLPTIKLQKTDGSFSKAVNFQLNKKGEWENVLIDVSSFDVSIKNNPKSVKAIIFSQPEKALPSDNKIWLDDISFIETKEKKNIVETPKISSAKGFMKHVDLKWNPINNKNIQYVKIYRSENGKDFKTVGIQDAFINRFADFTNETGKKYSYKISFLDQLFNESKLSEIVSSETKNMSDEELMTMVQEASFNYYWDGAETASGLSKENTTGRQNMIATGASGFGIMALIAGTERGFVTRKESVERFNKIVNFLEKSDKYHGAVAHFIDGKTGKTEAFFGKKDNGADLVETSFLVQGLLAAHQYFNKDNSEEKNIRTTIDKFWKGIEWNWFKQTPDSKYLYWHWSPDQAWIINHKLIGWNETMVTYLLAIASPTHSVPASMYYSGWASQEKVAQDYRKDWGNSDEGEFYKNGNTYYGIKLDVGVNKGGPLFFAHYSFMGYDPHKITDRYTNYFKNNQNITKINYLYCVENPKKQKGYGKDGWGLTASDGPNGYNPDEPVEREDTGKLTPTGAIASFPYTPAESMAVLKNFYLNYGDFLWGEYGFRDSFDLNNNWCSPIFMGLNQAPMTVMIENHRTGLIWNLFMSHPDIKSGIEKLEKEK